MFWRGFWSLLGIEYPAPPRRYTLWVDGVHACVQKVEDGGQHIKIFGWVDSRPWRVGDIIILMKRLPGKNVQPSTYKITALQLCWDPSDMYFMDLDYIGDKK